MTGVAGAAVDAMDVADQGFVAVEVTANAIGGGIHLAAMVKGLGVGGKGGGNRAVAIITVAGGPRLFACGRPLGAWERRNQVRRRDVAVGTVALMGPRDNVGLVMATGAGGAKIGDEGVLGVGGPKAKRG